MSKFLTARKPSKGKSQMTDLAPKIESPPQKTRALSTKTPNKYKSAYRDVKTKNNDL